MIDFTKMIEVKVMMGDSTITSQKTFDPKLRFRKWMKNKKDWSKTLSFEYRFQESLSFSMFEEEVKRHNKKRKSRYYALPKQDSGFFGLLCS